MSIEARVRIPFRLARYVLALLACLGATGFVAPTFARDTRVARAPSPLTFSASRHGISHAQIVSFGLYGPERVFEREARGGAQSLRAWFGGQASPVVRFNTRQGGGATPLALATSLRA